MSDLTSSEYINDCHRNFSMYVLQTRAFPSIVDGLRAGGRRLLWTARNGEKQKTATLSGATMPLHPHMDASDTVDTLTKPYCNNIPLFTGVGSFGTRLKPDASGAPRYTSVKVSDFTTDVIFADIELVPMVDNYDSTRLEPLHFVPLVPVTLVNPSEGIGVGFSCHILPRALGDIVDGQIAHLQGKKVKDVPITFVPFEAISIGSEVIKSGNTRWWFEGEFLRMDSSNIHVSNLPYGLDHTTFINHIIGLIENGTIHSYEDHSSNGVSIAIKFPRGALKGYTDEQITSILKLRGSVVENMNVVDFCGTKVVPMTYHKMIAEFTDWRLGWYVKRYELLKSKLERDIQRYRDIITAIKNNVGDRGAKTASKKVLVEWLESIGIVYSEYIADMPIYRLTKEEAAKAQSKLDDALVLLQEYVNLINDPEARRAVYIQELKDVKKKHAVTCSPPKKVK